MQNLRHPLFAPLVFAIAVVALAWLYDYPRVLTLGPVSHHYWRQSDGASMARVYHETGMHFFQPRMHHVVGGDNSGVAEFPLLYYAVAGLYHLFGPKDAVFRSFNFLILLAGLYALFRLLLRRLDDGWLALFPPLLLLGSPLVAFYGPAFLPNTAALGLIFIAAFLFFQYIDTRRLPWFYAAAGLALLAGLLKVSLLIPFLALTGAGLLCQLFLRRERWEGHIPRWPHLLAAAVVVIGVVAAWYLWARAYNARHQASYFFLIDIKPIWAMTAEARAWTHTYLLEEQQPMYFTGLTLKVLALLTFFLLLLPRKMPPLLYLTLWLALLGSAAFILLFYSQLAVHNYYILDIMPLPVLIVSTGLWLARRRRPGRAVSWLLRLGLLAVLVLNVRAARPMLAEYYRPNSDYILPYFVSLNKKADLRAFLDRHGIQYPDLAVVLGEPGPNTVLYYLNLRGWNLNRPVTDAELQPLRGWGAKYLVVVNPDLLAQQPLPESTRRPIGVFDGQVQFFDISLPPAGR